VPGRNAQWTSASQPSWPTFSLSPTKNQNALGDLLDGFVLTVLIAVALGTIYYAIRVVKELRRATTST
jgi:hypothetical protein